MGLFSSNKRMSRKEYNEWHEGFNSEFERIEKKVKPHYERYGDNRVHSLDVDATLSRLIDEHFSNFERGGKFPSKYLDFYNAHKREGYEIARCGSVLACRAEMIEDYKYSNDHYKVGSEGSLRKISLQGLDILAQCQAYDDYLEYKRREENRKIYDHRKDYTDSMRKQKNNQPIEVYCGNADVKKAETQLALNEFSAVTKADDSDFLDHAASGIKRFFGFRK